MHLRYVFFLLAACAVCGCGTKNHSVSGNVKLNGEAISDGRISFVVDGVGDASGPISNGSYSVSVPEGKAKVMITASKKMKLPAGQKGMYGDGEELQQFIPARFNTNTELKADISSASSKLDFDLKDTGPPKY